MSFHAQKESCLDIHRDIKIFANYNEQSLKFPGDLVEFLMSSPTIDIIFKFRPTDVLSKIPRHLLEKKCEQKYLLYYTIYQSFSKSS